MSGFIITMMRHLFKRLRKDVSVFYSQNLYFRYVRQPRNCSLFLSWEVLEITVRRKTGEGKRVLMKEKQKRKRWILGLVRKYKWGESLCLGQ